MHPTSSTAPGSSSLSSFIPLYEEPQQRGTTKSSKQTHSNNSNTGHYQARNQNSEDDSDERKPQITKNNNAVACGTMSPATSASLSTFFRSLLVLSPVRKRQLLLMILFISNFFFISWLVDGDPTLGELMRVEEVLEQRNNERRGKGRKSSGSENENDNNDDESKLASLGNSRDSSFYSADASWCFEVAEVRHQFRLSQRIAGPAFRQTIDLCQKDTPKEVFVSSSSMKTTANNNEEDDEEDEETVRENSWWNKETKSKRNEVILHHRKSDNKKDHEAVCGVSKIQSVFSPSVMESSWMIVPEFLKYFEDTVSVDDDDNKNEEPSSHEIEKRRKLLHLACGATKSGHIGQLPLVDELRSRGEISDVALLHSSLSKKEEKSHCRKYEHFRELEEKLSNNVHHHHTNSGEEEKEDFVFEKVIENLAKGAFHGTPLLQSSALASQYVAARSCSTPAMTLANVVVVVGEDEKKKKTGNQEDANDEQEDPLSKNEFASWRLWKGGPLIAAAVCREPPFKITIEVSPSGNWVEIIR